LLSTISRNSVKTIPFMLGKPADPSLSGTAALGQQRARHARWAG
jgi:hypothetical protein